MSFWVYMVRCKDASYYVGHTDDLEKRFTQHQLGEIAGYTRRRRPIELVFSQELSSRDEAFELERKLKGWSRAKKEVLVRGDWAEIRRLARSRKG
jgi:predicted GIY-YIG superfamily endonuclease